MLTPQCVAVDAQDNIYVTDSQSRARFLSSMPTGNIRRAIGSLKGGEGYFKRPTGIAVDSAAQRIYVTDTLRNKIFVMDMQGSVLQMIGKTGTGDGEFNYPDRIAAEWPGSGRGRRDEFPRAGARPLGRFQLCDRQSWRRRGMDVSAERHRLRFRRPSLRRRRAVGHGAGVRPAKGGCCITSASAEPGRDSFSCRPDLQIDKQDRIYVVDSFNRRVQVFHYYGFAGATGGAAMKRILPLAWRYRAR